MVLSNGSTRKRRLTLATTGATIVALVVLGIGGAAFADTPTSVVPQSPTQNVICGPNNDTANLPGSEYNGDPGVTKTTDSTYIVNPHGNDPAGTITVAAQPNNGYVYSAGSGYVIDGDGYAIWTFTDKNTACPPPATTYDAVLWQTHTYNQKYSQDKISVTNEDSIKLPTIPTTCGTSWQGDVYIHTTAESTWLSATTSLAGPDGAQDGSYLAPGGNGVAYIYVVNDACPPVPPAPITCTVTGAPYTESGDHPPVPTTEGWDFRSFHDGHATSVVIPIHGNAQGITSLTFTDTNVVGYGMFSRLIFDLSADGGPGYASFSVSPGNTIDQSAVAGVGSNSHLLGKTIAQVATAYPHNVYTGWGFQTGSSYPTGNPAGGPTSDGATLTGYSGDCGTMSFVPTKPADVVSHTSKTTEDCTSKTQTTITTTTTKPQVWDATATPPGYVVDTNPADWKVTDDSPGVTVALTSDQIAKDCPSPTPTPTPTASTPPASSGGANTDVFGPAPTAGHSSSLVNWGWAGWLLALIMALCVGFGLYLWRSAKNGVKKAL